MSAKSKAYGVVLAFALLLVGSFMGGCQSLAGIDEYRLGRCGEFCDTVMANCSGEHAVYTSRDACMGLCSILREGDLVEGDNANTLACRLDAARKAGEPQAETDLECQRAGPGGGDLCGTNNTSNECDNYCELFARACPTYTADQGNCATNCQGLTDKKHLSIADDYDGGDTLQCRLIHLSAAATPNGTLHCEHARIAHPSAHCVNTETVREVYCRLVTHVCSDDAVKVYESMDQCEAVAEKLELESDAADGNTVACRYYHTQNAISHDKSDLTTHCPHAGPGGDGHCGDSKQGNCDSYCDLVAASCPDTFSETWGDDREACLKDCGELAGSTSNSRYSTAKAVAGSGFPCRMLAAARAARTSSLCAADILLDDRGCE